MALVLDLFPRLKERFKQDGWSLSGGKQQMLAIGHALMSRPSLQMLDEPSLGLAPIVIEQVFDKIWNSTSVPVSASFWSSRIRRWRSIFPRAPS